jgi:photosystem II stability/assembly factor-like uncharacterized protein
MRTVLAFSAILAATPPAIHAQWTMENSNTTADLRGIHNAGDGVAWVSGTNGTVLRTEDGGYVWQSCSIPPGAEKLDFRGIQAFDANTAIVMSSGKGDLSRLYKTTDGCHSWKLLFTNPDTDGFWDAVYFDRGKWGWLLGDPVGDMFTIFASDDSGKTWVRQQNKGLSADPKKQGAFAASNSSATGIYGLITFASGGTGGAFAYSLKQVEICLDDCSKEDLANSEKKSSWERNEVPIGNHSEASGIFSIAERREPAGTEWWKQKVIAVGGDYLKPDQSSSTAAYSSDGGKTWLPAQAPPHGYRSAVAYDSTTKTWITVGPNGTDISTDDGKNWRALHPDPARHEATDADRNWNALSLPYVVGPHGRIGKLDEAALKR